MCCPRTNQNALAGQGPEARAKGGGALSLIVRRCFSCNQRQKSFEDNESFGSEVYLSPVSRLAVPRVQRGMKVV